MDKKVIEFVRAKDYKFIKNIGQGGTGKTVLLQDDIIDESFVCKKYSPYYEEHQDLFFENFIDEIKILHKLYHKNIVRVFNYYLYPEMKTGYILMEHIDGSNLKEYLKENPHYLNEIFIQTINGFKNLETNGVLHRDIRADNILVSNGGTVKIIDFGFGKKIKFDEDFDKSISLNWLFTPPKDFEEKKYNFQTEVYFIGKLFEDIIKDFKIENFAYSHILSEMIKFDSNERIKSFSAIERKILSKESDNLDFSEENKKIYKRFATNLSSIYSTIGDQTEYKEDIDKIISELEEVYKNSMLEDFIQNPAALARCFVSGNYKFYKKKDISVDVVKDFLKLFKSVSVDKQKIIINNLWQRIDTVERYSEYDDLPF